MATRTLVINLTRFGDLLQTQPVISGLKARGDTVGLVCLQNFAPAAGLLRDVDAVFGLPGSTLLSCLDTDWRDGLKVFADWSGHIRDFAPQRVINYTSTLPSRLLARHIDAPEVAGYTLDRFGFALNASPWAAFLLAACKRRANSPFNLVDLFWSLAGLRGGPRPYVLNRPSREDKLTVGGMLAAEKSLEAQGFLAVQLGASAEFRRWPVEYFARLADDVWKRHRLSPMLLGSKAEMHLAERFQELCPAPTVSLAGRTNLTELAAALRFSRMLVTNDTGTMHLGAGLGIPVCAIFLATAQPWDTGPYTEGALCIEADMDCHPCGFDAPCTTNHACRRRVRPEAVGRYVSRYLDTGDWALASGDTPPSGVRVWQSFVNSAGEMDLFSHSGHDADDRTAWIRLQRHFYRQFLDEQAAVPGALPPVQLTDAARAEAHEELHRVEQQFFVLMQQAEAISKAPVAPLKKRFMANYERLSALSAESHRLGVMGDLWREQAHDLDGDFSRMSGLVGRYYGLAKAWRESISVNGM